MIYKDSSLKRILEVAGVSDLPKSKKLLKENIEDEHSEVLGRFEDMKGSLHIEARKRFRSLMKNFDQGYERDDLDYMEDVLYDMMEILRT